MDNRPILFLIGHAGGFALSYAANFKIAFPKPCPFQLEPLELPGHGGRLSENLLMNLLDMEADLRSQLLKKAQGREYAIFGHSMGGLLGYLLSANLKERYDSAPEWLFISSSSIPGQFSIGNDLLALGDHDFWRACNRHFGSVKKVEALINDDSLRELFVPILRADLGAILNHSQAPWPRLTCPVGVIYADGDTVTGLDMAAWQRYFSQPLELFKVSGGHFHPLDSPDRIAEIITRLYNSGARERTCLK
ncbi:MAG: alpha/beta fold hydrolase [Deltaproteobacteria bacterium]|jgi:surfactin synthase thioesterase subunit|nr:alpha/beta fold hydrolase [Deltaproteobacteria bacterium]